MRRMLDRRVCLCRAIGCGDELVARESVKIYPLQEKKLQSVGVFEKGCKGREKLD
jgi:hypothetical protein